MAKKGYDKKDNSGAFGKQDTKPAGKMTTTKKAAKKKGGK